MVNDEVVGSRWPPRWDGSDHEEQPSLAAERPHPFDLRYPALEVPVVRRLREKLSAIIVEQRARVGPQVLDIVRGEPPFHVGDRVAMFLGMLILITQPGLPAGGFVAPVAQHRIERHEAKSREPR